MDERRPTQIILDGELVAPCDPTGEAFTLDQESKEGECHCSNFVCLIDSRNVVTQKTPIKKEELQLVG